MVVRLTLPQASLEQILLQSGKGRIYTAGGHRTGPDLELLIRNESAGTFVWPSAQRFTQQGLHLVFISTGDKPMGTRAVEKCWQEASAARSRTTGVLSLVERKGNLEAFGLVRDGLEVRRVDHLWIPGPGMKALRVHTLPSANAKAEPGRPMEVQGVEQVLSSPKGMLVADQRELEEFIEERLSRLAGVLGSEILRLAAQLRVFLLGCGRLGSLLAYRLAQSGVGRQGGLIIADSDLVEEHNFDCMLLPAQALGMPKAQAVATMAEALVPKSNVIPLVGTLSDNAVSEALISADVVFTAVDDAAARVGAAVLSARYHKVHVDGAGGAAYAGQSDAAIGGEIRVAIPGCQGCIACFGNSTPREALAELERSREEEFAKRAGLNWQEERPGSWGDVLLPIAGEALQEFWRLLAGWRRESRWWHYYHGENDMPVFQDWSNRAARNCPVCSRDGLQGRGDPTIPGRWTE